MFYSVIETRDFSLFNQSVQALLKGYFIIDTVMEAGWIGMPAYIKGHCSLARKSLQVVQSSFPVKLCGCFIYGSIKCISSNFITSSFSMPGANCCIVDCPTYASNTGYPALVSLKYQREKYMKNGEVNLFG